MKTLHTLAVLAMFVAAHGWSPVQASEDMSRARQLHSVGLQQAMPRYGDTDAGSHLRNGKYLLQLTNDGFLHLTEVDEQKVERLQRWFADEPEGRIKFESQLPGAGKRSIWKFDLRMGLAQAAGHADASAFPQLPPQLLLSTGTGDVTVVAVMKPEESPGGISAQLPIWTLATGTGRPLRLHLRANGNLTVEDAGNGAVVWQTGTCGGVLRGCGEVGRPR